MGVASRERIRSDQRNELAQTTWDGDPSFSPPDGHIDLWRTTFTHYERIVDEKHPFSGPNRIRGVGSCIHEVIEFPHQEPETDAIDTLIPGIPGFYVSTYNGGPNIDPRSLLDSHVARPSNASVVEFCLKAWEKFHLEIPESTSIGNFLLEAKQTKDLLPKFNFHIADAHEKTQKAIRAVYDPHAFQHRFEHYNKHTKVGRKVKLRRTEPYNLKTINGAFLQQQYGWLPLISDVSALTGVVDSVTKRLDFLRKTRGVPLRLHHRAVDPWSNPQVGNSIIFPRFPGDAPNYGSKVTIKRHSCTFTSSCTLVQDLQGLEDAWASWRGVLASLGLNNPAKILWNDIPFSFVIDMFIPISNWLNAAHLRPFSGKWEVSSVTTSVAEEIECEVRGKYTRDYDSAPLSGEIKISRYRRQLGLPLLQSEVSLSELSSLQQMLLGSLVIGNVRSL